MTKMTKKIKKVVTKNNFKNEENKKKKSANARLSVDDEINDVHDEDFYDEVTGLETTSSDTEDFERPW